MGTFPLAPLALGAALALAPSSARDDGSVETAELDLDLHRSFEVHLPSEQWHTVVDAIEVDGVRFAASRAGVAKLELDTDGDGRLDEDVKGVGGFVRLRGERADGSKLEYGVRLSNDGKAWSWSTSCALSGVVRGETVHLIDQDGNGRFDDFGVDAMAVGRRLEAAFLLSRVVALDGELFHLEVDGARLTTRPYAGETARLDVVSGWEGRGDLVTVVFADRSGDVSFDAVGPKGGVLVPAGTYELVSGFAEGGGESVQMRRGRTEPVELAAGDELELAWGGPITMDFSYDVRDEEVTVSADLRFYGAAGEEYHTFQPDAKSPKILIYDKKTGKEVRAGRFGGC